MNEETKAKLDEVEATLKSLGATYLITFHDENGMEHCSDFSAVYNAPTRLFDKAVKIFQSIFDAHAAPK